MIHPLVNSATTAILVFVLVALAFLIGGYWPRIRAALKGRGGHA